ncbi:Transposable element Tc3 transposase [Nibea albiflora]|uniref:Transposable element Tc3 transposase n=1 Tax=Nibea albiflora TaxID=240163 RepID=A0ACB7EPK2_NIBAL|nr:Transposable element Tc3 transposase [Nibea albiflora]
MGHQKVEESYLDSPGGFQRYWHAKEIPLDMFSLQHNGGDSMMIWGAFSFNVEMELQFVQGCQNAAGSVEILRQGSLLTENDWVFQQDVSVHNAHLTKDFFQG